MGNGAGEGGGEGRGAEGTGGKQKGEKPDTRFLLGTEEGRCRELQNLSCYWGLAWGLAWLLSGQFGGGVEHKISGDQFVARSFCRSSANTACQ